MNRLLQNFLLQRSGDRGFALPTALMFGLVTLLVGGILLIRSQDDRVSATLQQATSGSLNVTEGGATQITAFINNNTPIATYNLSDWLNATTTMSGTLSPCGMTTPAMVVNFATTATTWQNIDPLDASKGQFRLVNYTYTPSPGVAPNTAPGVGVLEVEGRSPDRQSMQRLRISIPVQPGDTLGIPVPGVWIADGGVERNTIQGNVLVSNCSDVSGIAVTGTDPATGEPYRARNTSLRLPALPPQPTPFLNSLPTSIARDTTLPRASDAPVSKVIAGQNVQVYEYLVTDLRINQSAQLTITPGQRVTFYVTGSIRKGGDIVHSCNSPSGPIPGCQPTNFQIFGYGDNSNSICLNGVNFIDAFILAPAYTVGVAGSGGSRGGIRGSVWASEWGTNRACGSGTSNITVVQMGNWDFAGVMPQNLPPKITPASSWERVEITAAP